jgi:hypothetical protein
LGVIEGIVELIKGERTERRMEKECSDMRNVCGQRESLLVSDAVAERKRLNQHSWGCGGCCGCGGGFEFERKNEDRAVEVEERRVSRVRVWEGRRRRSFWERKEWASEVAEVTRLMRFC